MSKTFMINVRIIDGVRDTALENGVYVMNHETDTDAPIRDRIEFVGEMSEYDYRAHATEADKVVDMTGYTILPGLFNVHSHIDLVLPYLDYPYDVLGPAFRALVSYRRAAEALNAGVTSLRCVGMPEGIDLAVKRAINSGMMFGPAITAAGPLIMADGGHGHNIYGNVECSGIAEFRKAARSQLCQGVDLIKIGLTGGAASANEGMSDKQMTDDEIEAVVQVAHAAGKKVAAHLGGDKAIQDAVLLGVDSVEHAYYMSEETARIMADKGTYLVPTLSVTNCNQYLLDHGSPAHQVDKLAAAQKGHRESIERAVKAGVKICCGTDLLPSDPIDGTTATIREVELLTEVGLSPMDAIKAATSRSAELCGTLGNTGTLEAGKDGDVIAVKGAPDKNIRDLRNIELVARQCRLCWSTIPGLELRRFHILPPGLEMTGGTYRKW